MRTQVLRSKFRPGLRSLLAVVSGVCLFNGLQGCGASGGELGAPPDDPGSGATAGNGSLSGGAAGTGTSGTAGTLGTSGAAGIGTSGAGGTGTSGSAGSV